MTIAGGTDYHIGDVVREHRERLGLSVRTLAARAGFSPSFISQVENGLASPSIASLDKIASCLEITLPEFFRSGEGHHATVVRAANRPKLESGWSKAELENLAATSSARLEPVLITLRPGGSSGRQLHAPRHEQFVYVVCGNITLVEEGSEICLTKGDAITVFPDMPVRWVNSSARPAQLLVVCAPKV
jgi:transcriptional regulator with XRE-family HTH domain